MENYKGTIWATWDRSAPPFLDYIGGYKLYLDLLLDAWDGREGGTEVIGGIHKWLMPCNWKFPAENFSGDRYHGVSHRSVDMVGHRAQRQGAPRQPGAQRVALARRDVPRPRALDDRVSPAARREPSRPRTRTRPIVADYFRRARRRGRRRRGEQWRLFGGPGTVFPNTSPLARQPRTLAVWHPRGPHRTEAWRWYLVDADAPAEVKEFLRQYYIRYSGPVGAHRAGRHGELELRPRGEPGRPSRASYPVQLRDGARATRPRRFEDHGLRLPGQISDVPGRAPARTTSAASTALAPVHGGGGLEGRALGPRGRERARTPMTDAALARLLVRQEVEDFLYHEAELLDERRYEEWLDLFTEDARYWMPMRRNVPRDEPEREFTREGAGRQLVRRGQGHADPARAARSSPACTGPRSRSRASATWSRTSRSSPQRRPGPAPTEVSVKSRFLDLPEPRRDGDRPPRRQARGPAAPRGRRLEDRPPQDHPRPERPARQEPHVLLLAISTTS